LIQRHSGFRTKKPLETELLAIPELQLASSSADLALEVGKSSGTPVERLQRGLNLAGHPVPVTSKYDEATQRAVASFQAEHGIPFPTGRQSGPRTLSTLDDHLLGNGPTPPVPPTNCATYEPGEREQSLKSPGRFARSGAFGQELRLFNFAAGKNRMKSEHEEELKRFVSEFELFDPESAFEVEFVRGFTDSVDSEELNVILREARAADVEFVMHQLGVPDTVPQAAADGSYEAGCDPSTRRVARAVLIRLKKKGKKPTPVPPKPTPRRDGCSDDMSRSISVASSAALVKLAAAIGLLAARPLVPRARDALWLAFRATSDNDAAQISGKLGQIASGLPTAELKCSTPGLLCSEGTRAFAATFFGRTITVCSVPWEAAGELLRERTLIHEGAHTFAGMSGLGESYHDDDCGEGDVAGSSRALRLQNADSYACLAMLLTTGGDLGPRVRHSRGEEMALIQKPKGTIQLSAPAASTRFDLVGLSDVGVRGTRWVFKDTAGRKYLLLADGGKEILSPDTATAFVAGITIGDKTRALLRERGVTDATMTTISEIPEVGQKVIELPVSLAP
jgi:peptidoglycan hydrolase-like protein with peptidoglycan-binding domain